MKLLRRSFPVFLTISLTVFPSSSNYALRELDFGAGGGTGQSQNYSFEGMVNEQGGPMSGTAYNGGLGFGFTQMAFTPAAPTVVNPGTYYNKLHVTIDPTGNPPDALYALAISDDNFTTAQYIKADYAIGSTLTFDDYQTYQAWGGASGFIALGLQPSTTYQVKVKAFHGDFTESGFGPTGTASTINPILGFDIDVSQNDIETNPPYITDIGTIMLGEVATATDKIWVDVETNAESGASVYIAGQNDGLYSNSTSYTIPAVTGNLDSLLEGFGIQTDTLSQGSGSALTTLPPYDGSDNQVGEVPNVFTTLFTASGPIFEGRGSVLVKAKSEPQAPARSDYREIFTIVSAANF